MQHQNTAVEKWLNIIDQADIKQLPSLFSQDVTFYSPVVYSPQVGIPVTVQYLSAALSVFKNDKFRYSKQLVNADHAMFEFETEIQGVYVNGIDLLTWNKEQQITEFKVMVRPLKAIQLIHQQMGAALEKG